MYLIFLESWQRGEVVGVSNREIRRIVGREEGLFGEDELDEHLHMLDEESVPTKLRHLSSRGASSSSSMGGGSASETASSNLMRREQKSRDIDSGTESVSISEYADVSAFTSFIQQGLSMVTTQSMNEHQQESTT